MKMKVTLFAIALTLFSCVTGAVAQGTAFTYQGQLQNNGSPAAGSYNLTFALYATNTGGVAIVGPVTNSAVVITNGLFTVQIDFGSSVWNGQINWLQIGVASNGVASFTTLLPRQLLTSIPQSIFAMNAGTAALAATVTNVGGESASNIAQAVLILLC